MTKEMAVQQNNSYAKQGFIAGGLAGTTAAWAGLKYKPEWTIQTQNITSWDDLQKVDDKFISSQISKEGEVGTNWKSVKAQKDAVKEATDNIYNAIPDNLKSNEAVKDYVAKSMDLEKAKTSELKKLVEKYTKEGLEGIEKDLTGADLEKKITESEAFKKAIKSQEEALDNALKEVSKVDGFSENIKKNVREAIENVSNKNKTAQEALKDVFKKLKSPNAMWTYIAGAVGLAVVGLGIGSMIKSKKEA